MKKHLITAVVLFFAVTVAGFGDANQDMIQAKETAAWQAYKDKNVADFQKVVDKDVRCVYSTGVSDMSKELADMARWNIRSFAFTNFTAFSDEPDVIVSTYTVKVDGTIDGKDVSGSYNAGSVWKKEGSDWLAIFHTMVKPDAAGAVPVATDAHKNE